MFIEINDVSTGTVINMPLNAYSINYVSGRLVDGKYRILYVLNNGLRKFEEFDSQSDFDDKMNEIKEITGGGGGPSANVYTYKGSCLFEDLPESGNTNGDVWNIEDDFTLDGKDYPAGTNVAWNDTTWDALAGSISDLVNITGSQTISGKKTFSVLPESSVVPTTDNQLVNKKYVDDTAETIQYTSMPSATSENIGQIVQYVGVSDTNYTNGYFYKCVTTSTEEHPLTELEANSGINTVIFPSSVVIPEIPPAGVPLDMTLQSSDSYYLNIQYAEADEDVEAQVSITLPGTGEEIFYTNSSGDGVTFDIEDSQYATQYNFSENITLNGSWEELLGYFLVQPGQTTYSWERISVQPESDMSNYYTKSEIDSMMGDITEVLSHLTVPTAIEQELSEI